MPAALTAHAEVLPRSLLAIVALFIAPGTPVLAATYTIIDVPGANYTHAAAINNRGVIAGDSSLFGGHGFLRAADGAFTFFEIKDSTSTTVADLNDSGWVVGSYQDADYASHGFIRKFNGRIIKISDRSGDVGVRGINKPGEVCGYINDSAFVRSSNGTITKFDPPGSLFAVARSINDQGNSTGDFSDAAHSHGFIRASDGTITVFDALSAADTYSFSINANGAVTGWFSDNEGLQRDASNSAMEGYLRLGCLTALCGSAGGSMRIHRRVSKSHSDQGRKQIRSPLRLRPYTPAMKSAVTSIRARSFGLRVSARTCLSATRGLREFDCSSARQPQRLVCWRMEKRGGPLPPLFCKRMLLRPLRRARKLALDISPVRRSGTDWVRSPVRSGRGPTNFQSLNRNSWKGRNPSPPCQNPQNNLRPILSSDQRLKGGAANELKS